ncbi:hypothetical protein GGI07_005439 [Coemansia sp. Benny D115]|nr:hypothetical protein GGI07_005439 [Coemansia sp. Benny D115]
MGKRKSSRKVVKKERPKLDKTFDCLFCNHEGSIVVAMDKEHKVGNLKCKICAASYQAAINHLSDAVDVYSEWIDACEEAKLREQNSVNATDDAYGDRSPQGGYGQTSSSSMGRQQKTRYEDDDERYDRDDNGVPGQLTDESDIDDF